MPVSMFGSWVLNDVRIIDFSSAWIGMLISSSKLVLCLNKVHLNLGVRLSLEFYCVIASSMLPFLPFV